MNLLFLIALSYTCFNQGIAWNFRDFKEWERIAPLCATGKKQSPINLSSDYVKINSGKRSIKFSDYNSRPSRVKLENDGYTVTANFEWQGKKPKVSGAALSDEVYNLYNAHCHWSTDNYNGTEHSIRGEKYAAEFHLVHLNAKYKTPEEARANSDGVAVVTILFEVNDSEDPHEGMQLFAALTQTVINPRTTSNLSSIDVASMLPDPFESFYSYKGSLTTPPCTENVHWLIVSEPQCVTSKSMEAVRRVVLANNDTHNIRPPQNRSNRVVKLYDHDSDYGF